MTVTKLFELRVMKIKAQLKEQKIKYLPSLTGIDRMIIDVLQSYGPMTREELVKKIKKPRTTIYDHLVKMNIKGIVEKYSVITKKRGRPKVYYRLSQS